MPTIRPTDQLAKSIADALEEAYQRGWDDAMDAVTTAASKQRPGANPVQTRNDSRPAPSYSESIARAVTEKPGMASSDIIAWLERHHLPANKYAVQSALKRLRRFKRIELRGTTYWPKKVEAANVAA